MLPINRKLLKENAKTALKKGFWMAVLVILLGSLLGFNWNGITQSGGSFNISAYSQVQDTRAFLVNTQKLINFCAGSEFYYSYDSSRSDADNLMEFYNDFLVYFNMTHEEFMNLLIGSLVVIMGIMFIVGVISLCVKFAIGSFLSAPVGVGVRRFFMRNRKSAGKFTDMFSAFRDGRYMKTVKSMFLSNIRIFGWSLLFYFPGLVKYYQYYFVPFIMAENPSITPKRAREISTQMTTGHKWQIFVLELSFVGWLLVCFCIILGLTMFSCGLLMLPSLVFVYPLAAYQQATFAELYAERREYALVTGMVSGQELSGF